MNRSKIVRYVLAKLTENKVHRLYHGSKTSFKEFDSKKQISGFYPGIYLTSSKERASSFGEFVYLVEVKGIFFEFDSNKQEDEMLKDSGRTSSGYLLAEKLKSEGHVGIKRGNEFIAFDSHSVKLLEVLN
jgi:hypothetical protein